MIVLLQFVAFAYAQTAQPVQLEKTIPLPGVQGRIDHLSIDVKNQRLFVAALGNNTVEVIDVKAGKRVHSITGLAEPQGVLYISSVNRLYVANGGDGTVRIFDGTSFQPLYSVQLGDDADNIRYDAAADLIYVGYGNGALGVLHTDGSKARDIKLDSHPESFQLEKNGPKIFVNLPKSRKIAVVDRAKSSVVSAWETGRASSNYPMALDEAAKRLFVVFRQPAQLQILDADNGRMIATLASVGDSDDLFFDSKRKRIYVTGGEGKIAAYDQQDADHYQQAGSVGTAKGARTSFFSPELDRLFVAVRQQGSQPAEIRFYIPK